MSVQIVVNHITRMQPGYICVAGIEPNSKAHIRPSLSGARLPAALLHANGGPFAFGAVVALGPTVHEGRPPEIEDHLFRPEDTEFLGIASGDALWSLLSECAETRLTRLFGTGLASHGQTYAVDIGNGVSSLGCLRPLRATPFVDKFDAVRVALADGEIGVTLPITDLRLYESDFKTPRREAVRDISRRLHDGVEYVLGVGLTRAWQRPGDTAARHWLQVNSVILRDDPTWQG